MAQTLAKALIPALATAGLVACAGAPVAPVGSKPRITSRATAPVIQVLDAVLSYPGQVAADESAVALEFSIENQGGLTLATEDAKGRQLLQAAAAAPKLIDIVNKVDFKLTGANLAEPLTASITKTQFLNGKAVIQFNHLPPGPLTVTATAYGANNAMIVEASGDGTVVPGKLTVLRLKCKLPPATQETGHIRIEMDCFAQDCFATAPQPVPTSFVPVPLNTVIFNSIGDPFEDGANGIHFENQKRGMFMALRTLTNDLMIVKNQDEDIFHVWPGTTINNAIAVRSGDDTFIYYLYGHRARLNGETKNIALNQTITAPGGLKIHRTRLQNHPQQEVYPTLVLTTPQGDEIKIEDTGHYLSIFGKLGQERVVHEVRGSLGTYNNGSHQDGLLLRDGTRAANLDAFLENWKASFAENLFIGADTFIPDGAKPTLLRDDRTTN